MRHVSNKKRWKQLTACVLTAAAVFTIPTVPAYALENETDTIWGSVPASVYITKAFYEDESNSITVPMEYFESIESGESIKDRAVDAFWEAQRQSCYLYGDQSINVSVGKDSVTLTRTPYFSLEEELKMRNAVEAKAEQVLDEILYDGMTDYQKAVAIYNYVVNAATYDWDAYDAIVSENCHDNIAVWAKPVSAYGTLIEGKSVCQGDAQAYTLLARKAGLTSMMATGTMSNGGGHAWNRVWANSQWYEVDCCFGQFCSSFETYSANTGVEYGGVGIMESSIDDFYGV